MMSQRAMQITIALKAKEFGTSSSEEIRLLESGHWYNANLKREFVLTSLADPKTSQNVFAYIASVVRYIAKLAMNYGGCLGNLPLTHPKVKNSWTILPRTKPSIMLNLLSPNDKRIVWDQIKATMQQHCPNPNLSKEILDYVLNGGEVAGHGINTATIGYHGEQAILFEFREVPDALKKYLPPEQIIMEKMAEKPLDKFNHRLRTQILNQIKDLVLRDNVKFNIWFRNTFPNVAPYQATNDQKIEWVRNKHPDKWNEWTTAVITPTTRSNGQNTPLANLTLPPPIPPKFL
jgi:RTX toxin RtxA